jgi:phosphohistidine phosphatase
LTKARTLYRIRLGTHARKEIRNTRMAPMKYLILLRHGKSDWESGDLEDHDRPLAKRGHKSAWAMGHFLARTGQLPGSAVTSSAARARSTLEVAMEAGQWNCPVRVTRTLYESTSTVILEEARAEPDGTETLLLVGHEPTWSELARLLMGGGSLAFPTAAILKLELACERWADVGPGCGRMLWLLPPRLLLDGDFDL